MRPRVVVDTNVIVSAVIAGGKPERVLDLSKVGRIELFLSPFILNEVMDVLSRPKFAFSRRDIAEAIAGIRPFQVVDPGRPRVRVAMDETDNRVIETALAARARFLVTGDYDLLQLASYRRLTIVAPADFLDALPNG